MRLLGCLLFSALLMFGQTLTLTGPATARQGQTIPLTLTLANPPASLAAAQWAITLPQGYTATAAAGAASSSAAKDLYCNPTWTLCLTVGINANVYAAGVVATHQVTIPQAAALGQVTIPLTGVLGATLDGDAAVLAAGATAYAVLVTTLCDINGDGKVTLADVLLAITGWLKGIVAYDQNGDGVMNVRDVQIVARAAGF